MISKNMYKVLKQIPRFPNDTNTQKLLSKKTIEIDLLFEILNDALNSRYIIYTQSNNSKNYYSLERSSFSITEAGQIELEEYESKQNSSTKSTWAIIISALSFIASIVAIILSICGVQ